MLKTTNIRTLKDRLSAFLRDVQRGDVILVTDRGRVVAEIRQPTVGVPPEDVSAGKLQRFVSDGLVKLGLPNAKAAYRRPGISVPDRVIDEALDATRGDR
jgi:antitoxin (DNA-binding transcriptional repressor) of toxin-antitoxin stability system